MGYSSIRPHQVSFLSTKNRKLTIHTDSPKLDNRDCKNVAMDPSCLLLTAQTADGVVLHTQSLWVPIEHVLNSTLVHCFMTIVYLALCLKASILSNWFLKFGNDCTPVASTVTRTQSHRAPLECSGAGDSHHWCPAAVWCFQVNMDQNYRGLLSNQCYQELSHFWGARGSNMVLPCKLSAGCKTSKYLAFALFSSNLVLNDLQTIKVNLFQHFKLPPNSFWIGVV